MVEEWLKILKKQNKITQIRLLKAIDKLLERNFTELDIKPMKGQEGVYRCRIGDMRLIFTDNGEKIIIEKIGFRGDIYK